MYERVYADDDHTPSHPTIAESYLELIRAYHYAGVPPPTPAGVGAGRELASKGVTAGLVASLCLVLTRPTLALLETSTLLGVATLPVLPLVVFGAIRYALAPLADRIAGVPREVPVRGGA